MLTSQRFRKPTVTSSTLTLVVALISCAGWMFIAGCGGGTAGTERCQEGEVIDEYICENGEWVEYGGGPCEDADCAPNGSCVQDGAQAYCDCDDGYEADSLSCVPEGGSGGDACEGVDCGANGSCEEDGFGDPRCNCDTGYVADGLTCVEEVVVDPCEDFTCGDHGECIVVNDEPECDCDAGYVEELMVCVPEEVDPCDDHDCGAHGSCYDDGGVARCNCDTGYEEQGGTCVAEDSPCDGQNCSGHGTCEVVGGQATCNCDSGYVEDGLSCVPAPPECTNASECALYVLPPGETAYTVVDYEDTGLYDQLDGPIVAAFGIEGRYRAYVFTETSFYRLNTLSFAVEASGPIGALDSDLDSIAGLQAAYSIPSGTGDDQITFIRNSSNSNHGLARLYDYDYDTGSFEDLEDSEFHQWITIDWEQPVHPNRIPDEGSAYRAMWLDLENERDFAQGSVAEVCDNSELPDSAEGLPYHGVLTPTDVHYGIPVPGTGCAGFIDRTSNYYSQLFQGFGNAPSFGLIGAAMWHNGALWWFSQGYYE